jgi:peptidoglycan hydrolase-like protein with peptidoglycan-binding domain
VSLSRNFIRSTVVVGVLCGVGALAGEPVTPKVPARQAAAEPELRQGDHGSQVEEVFRYLRAYGYFPNAELASNYPGWKPAVEREPASPRTFDASLEQAVRRFQGAQGLQVTGRVDEKMRALMRQPRCSVPDVSGTASFVARTPQPQTNLTYAFQNYTPDLPQASTRNAIADALAHWSAAAPLAFTEVRSTSVCLPLRVLPA